MPFQSAPIARSTGRLAARIDVERRTDDPFSRGTIDGLIWQASAELGHGVAGASVPASTIVRRARALIDAADGEPLSLLALRGTSIATWRRSPAPSAASMAARPVAISAICEWGRRPA